MKHILSMSIALGVILLSAPSAHSEQAKTTLWFGPPQIVTEATRMVEGDQVDEGMDLLSQALEMDLGPHNRAMVYTNLCMGHVRKQEYAQALELCERALGIRPGQWQAINNRGCAHHGLGNLDQAVRDFTRASILNPDNEDIVLNLTMAMQDRNRLRPSTEE